MAKSAKGLGASGFAEFMQNALSHHAQMLSDQITSSESRLHLAVTNQIGDIRMSVQRLFDLTADDGEVRLRHKIEDIRSSVQRLLDGDCGRESSISAAVAVLGTSIQKIQSQLNDSTIRGAGGASESVAKSVERLVESVDRLVEKDNSDGRRMIAVASQMQAIQTSVQKLVGAKEDRDVKHFEELKDVRLSMQRIFDQAQQSSDVRVQQLQCQVNSAHSDLLSGVAELGAVVLSGVGDLLTKRMVSLQADLLSGLQASQELTIQKLCVKSTDAEADAYPPETTSKT
jgi:phage-related protein